MKWSNFVRFRLNLELARQVVKIKCTLSDKELRLQPVIDLLTTLQSLKSPGCKIKPFDRVDSPQSVCLPPTTFIDPVQKTIQITTTALVLLQQPIQLGAPLLLAQAMTLGLQALGDWWCEFFFSPYSNAIIEDEPSQID